VLLLLYGFEVMVGELAATDVDAEVDAEVGEVNEVDAEVDEGCEGGGGGG